MEYSKLWSIYKQAPTWEDFLIYISRGRPKWIFLEAIETGWLNRIRTDLIERYDVQGEEVDILLHRYECIVAAVPALVSTEELKTEMMRRVMEINIVRGYLRFANYTAFDEPDDIIWTIDAELTKLGAGTPTKEECARSYTAVTGRVKEPGAVAIPGDTADEIAIYLVAQIEELHKHLAPGNEKNVEIVEEMQKLDELHSTLTGKSILGSELPERILAKT